MSGFRRDTYRNIIRVGDVTLEDSQAALIVAVLNALPTLLALADAGSRLPVTADGFRAIPEVDTLFNPKHPERLFMAMNLENAADFFGPAGNGDVICPVSECYKDPKALAAAEAARTGENP